ncbi:hypothetical protein N7456_005721 [Penicillium angulare]|uniref:Uncharacterized protein n=1 Tax=Penicillium angulare TaxID=116970 RepID=A0A9W9FYX6_9EURO|nr:hypothetical protein N7456_005721 [Penicillium angulare]
MTKAFSFFGIDLWYWLENFCHQMNQDWLVIFMNSIAKSLCSKPDADAQIKYLKMKNKLLLEGNTLAQRDIYLAEQIESQRNTHRKATPAEQNLLERNRLESKHMSEKLLDNWRRLKTLSRDCPGGPWIREDEREHATYCQRDGKSACEARQGCCAYGCGCCGKIRACTDVQRERPTVYLFSHCTSECSCCSRREMHVFSGGG